MKLVFTAALNDEQIEPAGQEDVCKALVMYEDVVAGNRAMLLLSTIARGIESGRIFCALWKSGFLADRSLLTIAAREAAAADIVLIALGAGAELPPLIQNWINLWLSTRNGRPKALAAVVGEEESPGTAATILFELQELARLGGVDFFSTKGATEARTASSTLVLSISHSKTAAAFSISRPMVC